MTADHSAAFDHAPPLACPVCEAPLLRAGAAFACANGHSFDIAREGYVNLLPAQHKSRGIEGDVAEMLAARRSFLDAGHYEPLLEELGSLTEQALGRRDAASEPALVLEAGCGEGYYIGHLAERFAQHSARPQFLGADLSKTAARLAAKRYRTALFFVADTHRRIYLADASVSVLLDIFSPRNAAEFARIVEPGGCAIVVVPSPRHLQSLRERLGLLGIEAEKEQRVVEAMAPSFALVQRREIEFELALGPDAVRELVEMGPNHWHDHEREHDGDITAQASFVMLELRRQGRG